MNLSDIDYPNLKNLKILVTGGAGFIGSHIVHELVRRGVGVRVLDNFSTGRRENLSGLNVELEMIEGDIRDYDTVRKAVAGMDVIFHEAALPSVPRSIEDPITAHNVNITGTVNVLHAAKGAGVKRVVNASSSSVYGDNPVLPKHEGMIPNPLSPYAVGKLAGEKYCGVFFGVYGLETVSLRYFNVFGPRQDPTSQYSAVIPKFITEMMKGDAPVIFGDGEQSRDFTYVDNVVHANLLAATTRYDSGSAINCACQERVTLNELVDRLNRLLESSIKPIHTDPRPGDIKHSFAAIERARNVLGYVPLVAFLEGLQKTVDWYRT